MPYRWTLTKLSDMTTEVLSKDPIGWDEGTYTIKRSDVYKGAFHEYTTSLKFHCSGGGKEFIDDVYASEDIDGRIDVLVEYDCDGSGTYDTLFNGIINLASYKTDGEYTTVNIEKSDLLTKLFNRDEISVDLETTKSIGGETITAPDVTTLPLHSQNIFYKSEMKILGSPYSETTSTPVVNSLHYKGTFSHQLTNARTDLNPFFGWDSYTDFSHPGYGTNTTNISELFQAIDTDIEYPAIYTYNLQFNGTFTDTVYSIVSRLNSFHRLVLVWGTSIGEGLSAGNYINLYDSGGYTTGNLVETIPFDTTELTGDITLNFNDNVYLYWFEDEIITSGTYTDNLDYTWTYDIAHFSLEINSLAQATTAKTILVHEAFNQVVDAIADTNNNFYSDFYGRTDSEKITYAENGCGSKIAITNGLNLRKVENTPIHCSFRELFDNFDCIHNIGMGVVDSKVRIEPLSYWFDSTTQIISLALVNHYEVKNANQKYINKIEIGYQKWESEFNGGLDDPNANHEYSTQISSVKNIYSKLAPYISSGYTIEFTRRKWNDEITQDWRFDNDNFIISVTRNPYIYDCNATFFAAGVLIPSNAIILQGIYFNIQITDIIDITNSTSNNGTFTVTYIGLGAFNTTIIIVAETIVTESTNTITITKNAASPIKFLSEKYEDSFSYGSGMTSLTTAYNLRLTPARMLLAHANVITAGLQNINGEIKFVTGAGNTNLQCSANLIAYTDGCQEEYSGQQLLESQSFAWNDSNIQNIEPIWGTETYSFEYPLTYQEFKTIKANPYGYIEFYKFADSPMYGFIMNMEYKMKTGMTKFELLKKA